MALLTPEEDRQADRKRVLKGAKIAYAARCASVPCVVRDISETGARLQVKDHASVPDTFELLIDLDGFEAGAQVVWRKEGEVGVEFLGEPTRVKPKRMQAISSSVPKRRGSLRREKPHHVRGVPGDDAVQSTPEETVGNTAISFDESLAAPDVCAAAEATDVATTLNIEDGTCEQPQDSPPHEPQDVITMDQASSGNHAVEIGNLEGSVARDEEDNPQPAPEQAPEKITRSEVPMFRDQVVEVARQAISEGVALADPIADVVENRGDEKHPDAASEQPVNATETTPADVVNDPTPFDPDPVEAELDHEEGAPASMLIDASSINETVAQFQEPFRSRVKTAFQAPARAADNLARPEVPIIPAPAAEASVEDFEVLTETAEMSDDTPCATNDMLGIASVTEVADELVDPVPESSAGMPVAQSELRPDLAAFVQLFAPVLAETPVTDTSDPDPEQTTAVEVVAADNTDVNNEDADTDAESPAPVQTLEIVDDVIICSRPTDDSPVPDFHEMQVDDLESEEHLEPIADEPVEPLACTEMLPCAEVAECTVPIVEVAVQSAPLAPVDSAPEVTPECPEAVSDSIVEVVSPIQEEIEDDSGLSVAANPERQIPILIAEDDPDDRMFMREAFGESEFEHEIAFVENGEELLAYLNGEGEYSERRLPGLILLDLNMPKMDGRTALLHIKANPSLRRIPVIILTTSKAEDDIEKTYDLGVSSYISKPSSAEGLKEVIGTLNAYWSNLVALPSRRGA